MVKNTSGGSGHKGQARKNVIASRDSDKRTRFKSDEAEMYAIVTANLGNGMCHVMTTDGTVWLCYIRGKFRGRSKKDNIIAKEKWVLVGRRTYESCDTSPTKKSNCDLLEVYSDLDVDRLKASSSFDYGKFQPTASKCIGQGNDILFTDSTQEDEHVAMTSMPNTQRITLNGGGGGGGGVLGLDDADFLDFI